MENTYLIKCNEQTLKTITRIGLPMDVIEIETPADMARVNILIKAMNSKPVYQFLKEFNVEDGRKGLKLSEIFHYNRERYYSSMEVLDMLTELYSRKNDKDISYYGIHSRIKKLMDKIIHEQRWPLKD